ncbi:MAG: hypothetical protein H6603_02670 [Flavobacteriales bacterium]|nr:hypothetical protein [Flavobacteriales bacterium]MCB9203857.1 hypothetical protein [Flavobacteriales bacterium]
MKNVSFVVLLAALSVLLWGCPYKSMIPLSEPTEYVNKQVLGKWMPKSQESNAHPEYYVIAQKDTVRYAVDHFQYNENDSAYETKLYTTWTTRIDNIQFMNVQQDGQREVTLYRLDVMGDDLMILYEVTNNIDEKFTDSKKMQEFFKKYKSLSFFYNGDEVELIKVRK